MKRLISRPIEPANATQPRWKRSAVAELLRGGPSNKSEERFTRAFRCPLGDRLRTPVVERQPESSEGAWSRRREPPSTAQMITR